MASGYPGEEGGGTGSDVRWIARQRRHQEAVNKLRIVKLRRKKTALVGIPGPTVQSATVEKVVLQKDFANTGTTGVEVTWDVDASTNEVKGYVPELPSAVGLAGYIMYSDGSTWQLLAPGTLGQVLTINGSGLPVWS